MWWWRCLRGLQYERLLSGGVVLSVFRQRLTQRAGSWMEVRTARYEKSHSASTRSPALTLSSLCRPHSSVLSRISASLWTGNCRLAWLPISHWHFIGWCRCFLVSVSRHLKLLHLQRVYSAYCLSVQIALFRRDQYSRRVLIAWSPCCQNCYIIKRCHLHAFRLRKCIQFVLLVNMSQFTRFFKFNDIETYSRVT